MKITCTALPGVCILEPQVFSDDRGYLLESFSSERYREVADIKLNFVQDNFSFSGFGVLRGLHFQRTRPQGKLIQVITGSVFDVVVDIDPASPTFRQHIAMELSTEKHQQIWIPPGYAHGFCVTSENAIIHYKCTDYYDPTDEGGLAWNCPKIAIPWPILNPILSKKDQQHPGL